MLRFERWFRRRARNCALACTAALLNVLAMTAPVPADDCNRNGTNDAQDIANGTSADCNENEIPDECDVRSEDLGSGALPYRIAYEYTIADLNNDGLMDVVDIEDKTVYTALNLGGGRFSDWLTVHLDRKGYSIFAGDLDGDGFPDVIVIDTQNGGAALVLKNDGAAHFAQFGDWFAMPNGRSLQLTDIDSDGDLDIVTSGVNIYLNAGDGTFGTAQHLSQPSQIDDIVDMDGDDAPELIVEDDVNSKAIVYWNDQTGDFPTSTTISNAPGSREIGRDFDGDGRLDIIVIDTKTVRVFRNIGGGRFSSTVKKFSIQNAKIFVDLDADGRADCLATSHSGEFDVYLNRDGEKLERVETYEGTLETHARVIDVDHDGYLDICTEPLQGPAAVPVLYGRDAGRFLGERPLSIGYDPVVVDLNNDGWADIVFRGGNAAFIAMNDGSGDFGSLHEIDFVDQYCDIRVGDLDRDGYPDLAVMDRAELEFWRNDGTGGFAKAASTSVGGGADFALADFDHDGWLDAAIGVKGLTIYRGQSDGTFGSPRSYELDQTAGFVRAVDLDSDGESDLLIKANGFRMMHGNGDGTFGDPQLLNVDASKLEIADLDGDGAPDLVAILDLDVTAYLNDRHGHFEAVGSFDTNSQYPNWSGAIDLDGNGTADIIIALNDRLNIIPTYRIGDSDIVEFGPRMFYNLYGENNLLVAAADFNHDGATDLVVEKLFGSGSIVDGIPRIVFNDVNADGVPDICERGDSNCDGAVDFSDIDAFVTALVGQAAYEAKYPGCDYVANDCNFDASVNFADIDAFVGMLVTR